MNRPSTLSKALRQFLKQAMKPIVPPALLVFLLTQVPVVYAKEAFTVNFGSDSQAQTIGDLRPKVLALDKKPVPDVSIEYVMKRYRGLFENALTPEVRIEALDRINHLSASYGITEKGLTIDPYVQAEVVLELYQRIVDSGEQYQQMDELLYQTAKATAFTGNILESIRRLELLVGLYPNSRLAEEALFRLGENYFDLAEFQRAKGYYKRLASTSKAPRLLAFSEYKLAWIYYRQESGVESLQSLSKFFDFYPGVYGSLFTTNLSDIPAKPSAYRDFDLPKSPELLADGVRLLALLNQSGDRIANIKKTAEALGGPSREPLVLRAMVDQFSSKKRYFDAARLIESYAESAQLSKELFNYSLRAVRLYAQGEHTIESWKAKANLVDRFGLRSPFWSTADAPVRNAIRQDLRTVVEELAHLNALRAQESASRDQRMMRYATDSAAYYLQLAALQGNSAESFESRFLAAQELERAGQDDKALDLYVSAGFSEFDHQYRERSAYASLLAAARVRPEAISNTASWSRQQFELAERYLSRYPHHEFAAGTALSMADQHLLIASDQETKKALALLEGFAQYTNADLQQQFDAGYMLATVYYNESESYSDYMRTRDTYERVHDMRTSSIESELIVEPDVAFGIDDGLANTGFQMASLAETPEQRVTHYIEVFERFPNHRLAPDAIFNAASLSLGMEQWVQASRLHRVFLERFADNDLRNTSRQQLIASLERSNQTQEAADELMAQARALVKMDASLSANSAYTAAGYYIQNGFEDMADDIYTWLLSTHPTRTDLAVEVFAFRVDKESEGSRERFVAAELLVDYVEENSLNDARSATLASENALILALRSRDQFNQLSINQPFKKSLSQKTAALNVCTEAFKRVMAFGIREYANAARFEMADIYQSLAHAIIDSERPSGLSALEQEQYDILLEEQAIPIEEEAIALHEQNINAREKGESDSWIQASYESLARLNPSLYARPLLGPSHAPFN